MKIGDKRAISPVIATVLLVAMVVVLGLIVFLWMRGFTQEAVYKFGSNIELQCDSVSFTASYSSGTLYITNSNIPIYRFDVQLSSGGSYDTSSLKDLSSSWPEFGLDAGGSFSGTVSTSSYEEMKLIPVLIGETDNGEKQTYVCENKAYTITL